MPENSVKRRRDDRDEALHTAREFAGNLIRYADRGGEPNPIVDDEHLLVEQAWDVVQKVNAVLGESA